MSEKHLSFTAGAGVSHDCWRRIGVFSQDYPCVAVFKKHFVVEDVCGSHSVLCFVIEPAAPNNAPFLLVPLYAEEGHDREKKGHGPPQTGKYDRKSIKYVAILSTCLS